MTFNIGINVIEVEGRAVPSLQPAMTSVAGFIIRSKRGVAQRVVRVTSWDGFVEHFGGHTADAVGAYALQGFFANGGTTAYLTRVLPPATAANAPAPASRTFSTPPPEGGGEPSPILTVTAAYRGEDDPGAWGNDIAIGFEPTDARNTASSLVDLVVRYPGRDGREVERWEGLDFAAASTPEGRRALETRINPSSRYIKVSIAEREDGAAPAVGELARLGEPDAPTGSDGSFDDASLVEGLVAALDRFDVQPIQLLACPETSASEFVTSALAHCERLGDRMFVGHVPLTADDQLDLTTPAGADANNLLVYSGAVRGDKIFGALYGPNITVLDPIGSKPRSIPPTGHVLGVYARTDRERGIWKAPAGDATRLRGVLDVTQRVSDADHTYVVKQLGINLVRPIVGKGIVIDSARTLSTNTKWLYVNVRLLFNFVKSSLKNGLRWVVGEPNDPGLWGRVEYDSIRPFLMGLWRAGAFGPGKPEDVFEIKIDRDNNSPEDIEQGRLNVEIYFRPSRPAETIVVRIGQQPGASSASDG